MPVRSATRTIALVLLCVSCRTAAPVTPVEPTPTPQGPSQTAAEAKRDGVRPEVAAMTLDQRTQLDADVSPSVTTDEGVWRIAWPRIKNRTYGEVLLLDDRRTQIIRAFPVAVPPRYLTSNTAAIYCAAPLPVFVCRIDRRSRELTSVTNDTLDIHDLVATDRGVYAKASDGTWTRLDARTLTVTAKGLPKPF